MNSKLLQQEKNTSSLLFSIVFFFHLSKDRLAHKRQLTTLQFSNFTLFDAMFMQFEWPFYLSNAKLEPVKFTQSINNDWNRLGVELRKLYVRMLV